MRKIEEVTDLLSIESTREKKSCPVELIIREPKNNNTSTYTP